MNKPNPYCPFCHGTGRKRVQNTTTGGFTSEIVACPCHEATPASNSESRKREEEAQRVDIREHDEFAERFGRNFMETRVSNPPTPPVTVKSGPLLVGATMKISATTFAKVNNPGAALLHHVEALLMSVNAAGARADYITLNVEGQK